MAAVIREVKKIDPGGNIGRFCTVYMKKKPGILDETNREFRKGKSLVTLVYIRMSMRVWVMG